MTLGESITKRIDELLYEKGWSLYKLSQESCIALSTLKNIYTGHTKCLALSVIYKLADAFKISPIEFIDSEYLYPTNVLYD